MQPTRLYESIPEPILQRLTSALAAATGADASILAADEGVDAAPVSVGGSTIAQLRLDGDPRLRDAVAELLSHACELSADLRERGEEMTALAQLSSLLSGRRDTKVVLDTVVRSVTELLGAKAAAIRLLEESGVELRVVAVNNLSPEYQNKGPILLEKSRIDQRAFEGEVVYVADMANDPRILYPQDATREGLASMICVGMIYRGRPVGALRVYTGVPREFTPGETNLLRGVGQLAAAFIRNAQLDAERAEQMRIQRQVELAADVQKRLMPSKMPEVPPFEVYGWYEPCFELGGDFFDFIQVGDALGVMIGDVVGKGVAAGLLMSCVRTALRAHAEDRLDIDKVMAKVNTGLVRDTLDNEFATVFYGMLDTKSRKLVYCSAGHDPGMLFRDGRFTDLTVGGMPLGIDATQVYEKGLLELRAGDVLMFYTDGVTDASNYEHKRFTRERVRRAVAESANGGGSARDIVNHILWETRRFVGLNQQGDDMTLVAIRVH